MTSAADEHARPDSPDSPTGPSDAAESPESTTASGDDLAELAAAEPVDTEPLERSRQAIDEGHEAAAKALDPAPDDEDLDLANVKQNEDADSADNAVPRPN